MASRKKQEVITFKADASLAKAMRGMPNRSEFIRNAVLAAMENVCPLCLGTGILSADQRRHWEAFARNHRIEECRKCHGMHIVCAAAGGAGD